MTSTKISEVSIKGDHAQFQLHYSHPSMANAIRRTLLSSIPTLGFDTSQITFIENSCNFHNEMIALRISLVPVILQNIEEFDTNHIFEINRINNSDEAIYVTTEDFTCNLETIHKDGISRQSDHKSQKWIRTVFPPDSDTGDFIPICLLNKGEKIHLTCKLTIGKGLTHAQFSPVCQAVFSNIVDRTLAAQVLAEKISKADSGEVENVKAHFKNYQQERYYYQDEHTYYQLIDGKKQQIVSKNANRFQFSFESIGIYTPSYLLGETLRIILHRLFHISELVQGRGKGLTIQPSDTVMKGFDFIFENEDHTTGNLLSCYLTKYYIIETDQPSLSFVGYNCPHPLQPKIVLRISACHHLGEEFTDSQHRDTLSRHIIDCVGKLTSIFSRLHKQWYAHVKEPEPSIGLRANYNDDGLDEGGEGGMGEGGICLLYTSPSPRDGLLSRMPSSA